MGKKPIEENEESELWRQYKLSQKERRAARREVNIEILRKLYREGYEVKKLTDYHFRINGILDIYPTHGKYHDLTASPHFYGGIPYGDLHRFVVDFFEKQAKKDGGVALPQS